MVWSGRELAASPVNSISTSWNELQPVQLKSVSMRRLGVTEKARPRLAWSGKSMLVATGRSRLKGVLDAISASSWALPVEIWVSRASPS